MAINGVKGDMTSIHVVEATLMLGIRSSYSGQKGGKLYCNMSKNVTAMTSAMVALAAGVEAATIAILMSKKVRKKDST